MKSDLTIFNPIYLFGNVICYTFAMLNDKNGAIWK